MENKTEQPVQRYVLGFAFTPADQVALIQKAKPEWQKGLLNGIGGKVEDDETNIQAMVREFKEETGVEIGPVLWQYRGIMHGPDWRVEVYSCVSTKVAEVKTMEAEKVVLPGLWNVHYSGVLQDYSALRLIDNVQALIHLCRIPPSVHDDKYPTFCLTY